MKKSLYSIVIINYKFRKLSFWLILYRGVKSFSIQNIFINLFGIERPFRFFSGSNQKHILSTSIAAVACLS